MTGSVLGRGSEQIFSLHHHIQTGSGDHAASIQSVPVALSLGVKQLGCEADHLSPASAEVKNAWSYNPILPYVFMVWRLIKHRDNFTFIKYVI
jgi:hypothetical protein